MKDSMSPQIKLLIGLVNVSFLGKKSPVHVTLWRHSILVGKTNAKRSVELPNHPNAHRSLESLDQNPSFIPLRVGPL